MNTRDQLLAILSLSVLMLIAMSVVLAIEVKKLEEANRVQHELIYNLERKVNDN